MTNTSDMSDPTEIAKMMTNKSDMNEHLRKQISLSSLNSNGGDRLYGRSAEESILMNSYYAALTLRRNSPANIVLISGESGFGKTKLAGKLRTYVEEDEGFFIRGKFDLSCHGAAKLPYSGISNAFEEFCNQLEKRPDDRSDFLRALARNFETNNEEAVLLCEAFPCLNSLLPRDNHDENSSDNILPYSDSSRSTKNRSNRLNYVLKKFISAITSVGETIIFLLDDMQWSDACSLSLIKTMARSATSPFIFVFTYRPIPDDHPFIKLIDELAKISRVDQIMLRGLDTCDVHELVCDILDLDMSCERCYQLSSFLRRITNGNPLFIRQHLISLFDKEMIYFDDNKLVWDFSAIEESQQILISLDTMTCDKIRQLPESTQIALTICACIGSKISLRILGILCREICLDNEVPCENDVSIIGRDAIYFAIEDGLLVKSSDQSSVTFVHDTVQSAAYSIIDTEDREQFHWKLGQILKSTLNYEYVDSWPSDDLFTVAYQFARGSKFVQDFEKLEVLNILLRAIEESKMAADFMSAHYFYEIVNERLLLSDWKNNYTLCCRMYLGGAENALWAVELHKTDRWLNFLTLHTSGSCLLGFRALWVRVNWIAATSDSSDAIDYGLQQLRKLSHIKISQQNVKLRVLIEMIKTERLISGHTEETLLSRPRMTNERMIEVQRILNLLYFLCAGTRPPISILIGFKSIELNMKYGISPYMPYSIAWYGLFMLRFGRISTAESFQYGQIALRLQDSLKSNESNAQVAVVVHGMINLLVSNNLSDCVEALHDGHLDGLRAGEVRQAMLCAHVMCIISFHSGEPLAKVTSTIDKFTSLMRDYNLLVVLRVNLMYQKALATLTGLVHTSRGKDTNKFFNSSAAERENACAAESMTAYIFKNYDTAWQVTEEIALDTRNTQSHMLLVLAKFYRAMSAIALLQGDASNKRRLSKAISSSRKFIKKMSNQSPINFNPISDLLEAEYAIYMHCSLRSSVCTNYQSYMFKCGEQYFISAIELFSKLGRTHLEALAWERFGTHHLTCGNQELAYEKLRKAHKLYRKWGARAKCELMEKEYTELLV